MTAYQSYIDREWPRHKDEPAYLSPEAFVRWIWDNYEPTLDWSDIVVGALEARDAEIARRGGVK